MSMASANEAAVFAVVADVISDVCDIERELLSPERRMSDLDIDSLFAGEIMARTERELDIDIDVLRIRDDWSDLTLGDLAAEFVSAAAGAR